MKNVDGYIANICLFNFEPVFFLYLISQVTLDESPFMLKYYGKYVFGLTVNDLSYLISIFSHFFNVLQYKSEAFRLQIFDFCLVKYPLTRYVNIAYVNKCALASC